MVSKQAALARAALVEARALAAAHENHVVRSFEPLTLEECAERLGVSKQAVQQAERRALAKCATVLTARGIAWKDLAPEMDEPVHPLYRLMTMTKAP